MFINVGHNEDGVHVKEGSCLDIRSDIEYPEVNYHHYEGWVQYANKHEEQEQTQKL